MMSAAPTSSAAPGFLKRFQDTKGRCSGDLLSLKEAAWTHFEALGFPTRRQEAWRNLNLRALQEAFSEEPAAGAESISEGTSTGPTKPCVEFPAIVIQAGTPEQSEPLPSGVSLSKIESGNIPSRFGSIAGYAENAFNALNTALFEDALYLRVTSSLDQPLCVVYAAPQDGGAQSEHPRLFIEVDPQVECMVIEEFVGSSGPGFMNPVTEIWLGENSRLHHHRLTGRGSSGWHIGSVGVAAGRNASYTGYSIVLEGGLVRVDLTARLEGPGAEVNLLGVYTVDGSQVVDHHTHVTHAVEDTHSHQLYRGILAGKSRGVFNGRVTIAEDAQRVSADQVNNNLLLSDTALIHTNPQLEIFADDVACRHGATIGQLDAKKVFYLRTRGIPEEEARALLTQAFLDEVLERLEPEALRVHIQETIRGRFFAGV